MDFFRLFFLREFSLLGSERGGGLPDRGYRYCCSVLNHLSFSLQHVTTCNRISSCAGSSIYVLPFVTGFFLSFLSFLQGGLYIKLGRSPTFSLGCVGQLVIKLSGSRRSVVLLCVFYLKTALFEFCFSVALLVFLFLGS